MDTEELLKHIIDISQNFKAMDIKILKVDDICEFTDYFVLMSGSSNTHIKSMCEEIILKCKHMDRPAISIEGLALSEWCLLDFGDIVTHVFRPEKREFYNLEELWSEAKEIPVP